ncbi:MAG TPA: arginase [Fimbriimonadaceae bacterium]|nr:arginase [Fimbriimonadaceae bacterium]HRJ97717.1 arginase [Fimbriimonadaceae bacterium]
MIDLIGAPFDLCGRRAGSRLGPAALRLANLAGSLAEAGQDVEDLGDIPTAEEDRNGSGLRGFEAAIETYAALKEAVSEALLAERMPMVLGGDHSLAIGSIAGALSAFGNDLAVLWVDAHVDLNTPGTSRSGNLHGMPVAALLGLPSGSSALADTQWRVLIDKIVPRPALGPDRIAWIGLRDADRGEREALRSMPDCLPTTMQDIDRFGVDRVVREFDAWIRASGASKLWISFDVDALDPILAPGTGTAVRGGLSYREAHLSAELLRDHLDAGDCPYRLVGLDLVETNPLYDSHNETAQLAVEWIASLFGKTILGSPSRIVR